MLPRLQKLSGPMPCIPRWFALIAGLAWLSACAHPATRSVVNPTPAAPVHGEQRATRAGAVPSASPSSMPSVVQTPRALPSPRVASVPRLAPDAHPRIINVAISETTVHPGDRVSGNVVTSSNVASVQARIGGYAMSLQKVGVGRFALSYTVNVPWFIRGNFDLHVIATNTGGATVERVIPLMVR